MRLCRVCKTPLVKTNPMGRWPRDCSDACRKRAREEGLQQPREPDTDPRELGPEVPLDGVSEEERERQRRARVVELLREGVSPDGVAERFGLSRNAVMDIGHKAGLRFPRPSTSGLLLPYGPPVR